MLRGIDAQTAPSCPVPAAHCIPRFPTPRGPLALAAVGALTKPRSPPFQWHPLGSFPSRSRWIPSLPFPAYWQVLKDAREPLGTLANPCPFQWYPRSPAEQLWGILHSERIGLPARADLASTLFELEQRLRAWALRSKTLLPVPAQRHSRAG